MTIKLRVQTSQKEEDPDLVGTFNTLKKNELAHLIDILKNQSVTGNIVTGDLFFDVSKIDHVANEPLDDSFFHLVKKGDN